MPADASLDAELGATLPSPGEGGAWFLEVVKDGRVVGRLDLGKRASTILGRNSKMAHEVLDHQSISRKHAVVFHRGDGGLYLYDLKSAHGTFLGEGEAVTGAPVKLSEGSKITFGKSSRVYNVRREATTRAITDADSRAARKAEIDAITKSLLETAPKGMEAGGDSAGGEAVRGGADSDEDGPLDEEDLLRDNGASSSPEDAVQQAIERLFLPVSHEVELKGHSKAVTAISTDPAGGRVMTGSLDYKVRLYDFGGMDRHHRSFREVEPEEGNVVIALASSISGDKFLACTASCQPKIYDRDGMELMQFIRGDMYIRDTTQTKGHIMSVTGGHWHPANKGAVFTSSLDGTVRIWDLNGTTSFGKLHCKQVLKVRSRRGQRVPVTACGMSPDGRQVAAGGEGGSLHLIPVGSYSGRAEIVDAAHGSARITCSIFHGDGHLLFTRGTDDCVRIWDVRKLRSQIKSFGDIRTYYETSGAAISPDGRTLCAGMNITPKSDEVGTLRFYDIYGSETQPQVEVGVQKGASVICVAWQPRTQQLLASTSSGVTKVFYSPTMSSKGALLSASRQPRAKAYDYAPADPSQAIGEIINPNALPMYRQ